MHYGGNVFQKENVYFCLFLLLCFVIDVKFLKEEITIHNID